MKISELISILERVQEHFADCDASIAIPSELMYNNTGRAMILGISAVSFEIDGEVTLTAGKKPEPTVVPA